MPVPVRVQPLDLSATDAPVTQIYWGFDIVVDGSVVGNLTSWQPAGSNMAATHTREISFKRARLPIDLVPGMVDGFTVSIAGQEIWDEELELRLGYASVWENLSDQTRPFTVRAIQYRGSSVYKIEVYRGCYITSKNIAGFEAEGDGVVRFDAEITYVSKTIIFG